MTKAHRQTPSGLSRHSYLNPDFMPSGVGESHVRDHHASSLAGEVWAMISTIECAFDAASNIPSQLDGISTTLGVAANMASDLIERCEFLERDLAEAKDMAFPECRKGRG